MENKFDGDTGVLERKHIQDDGLVYIGKEANKIEDQPLVSMPVYFSPFWPDNFSPHSDIKFTQFLI